MPDGHSKINVSRRGILRIAVAGPFLATGSAAGGQEPTAKRIYIAADDHTDYMWTADEQTYRQAFLETIDHYLDLADQTDDRPQDFQSRWNCDGLLWFREYEQNRNAKQVERLVGRIKSGHISIPMTMLVSCYGGAPTEAVLRGLYYGGHVERKYDLRIPIAIAMENQTLPYGLGMLWAGSGVRYSWRGICGCVSKLNYAGGKREHDVYWWVGPDGSRILMKWYSLVDALRRGAYWNQGPGGYAEARHVELAVKFVDNDAEFRKRNPHSVIGLFGQGWDDLKTIVPLNDPNHSFPVVAERLSGEDRRVIVSNEHDYFQDMEAAHGDGLPEVSCAFGNEWDLYSASMAELSASVKRATEKLRAAEAMATLVTQHRGDFGADLQEMRLQAWIAFGLYWEHDWTADGGKVSKAQRAAWQRKIAKQISDYVDTLHDRASSALGDLIGNADDERRFFVFNALAWERTDYVEIPIENNGSFSALDVESNHEVASQNITRDGKSYLRILASAIPACGYRVYRLRPTDARATATTIEFKESELSSSKHRLRIRQNGSIDLWESRALSKQIVAEGQLANEFEAARGEIKLESSGPVSTTVRIDVARPTARTTRITLFESLDRIEIENTIRENFSEVESWRYEFNLDSPQSYHEEVGAIIRAATKSEGGDYADRNARTDWLTMNHFVTMHDASAAVTISNCDCQFFHLGENVKDPMDSSSSVIHVLAGGQVDGPKMGIEKQGGDDFFRQRFALQCKDPKSASDRAASMRFALEHQSPLVAGQVSIGGGELDGATHWILQCDSRDVIVWAVKPSENGPSENGPSKNGPSGDRAGQGTIVRLWNLSSQPSSYKLKMTEAKMTGAIKQCRKTTHVETDIEPMEVTDGTVSETLPSGAMRTLRILAD